MDQAQVQSLCDALGHLRCFFGDYIHRLYLVTKAPEPPRQDTCVSCSQSLYRLLVLISGSVHDGCEDELL